MYKNINLNFLKRRNETILTVLYLYMNVLCYAIVSCFFVWEEWYKGKHFQSCYTITQCLPKDYKQRVNIGSSRIHRVLKTKVKSL